MQLLNTDGYIMMSYHINILMYYFFSPLPHELQVSRASSKIQSGSTFYLRNLSSERVAVIRTNENLTRHVGTERSFIDRGIQVEDMPKYSKSVIYQTLLRSS